MQQVVYGKPCQCYDPARPLPDPTAPTAPCIREDSMPAEANGPCHEPPGGSLSETDPTHPLPQIQKYHFILRSAVGDSG